MNNPSKRNRGKHSNDDKLFSYKWLPVFTEAVNDFCFLLSRAYAENSITQIVGNRYKLNKRQRSAIQRISSSDQHVKLRKSKECNAKDIYNSDIQIDGFNLLILLESAFSGAYVFKCRDGTYRDISGVHGSYKRVSTTEEVIILTGKLLQELKAAQVKWYFDQPVSNSGRLKTILMEISNKHNFNWEVELVPDPDKVLIKSKGIIVSSDGEVISNVQRWFNLAAVIINNNMKDINVIKV